MWHFIKIEEEKRCEPRLNTKFTSYVIILYNILFISLKGRFKFISIKEGKGHKNNTTKQGGKSKYNSCF